MSAKTLALVLLAALPGGVWAAWQTVATEQGRRIEIDRESVAVAPDGAVTAKGRIVLDKPLVDPKTSAAYRIIEVESRFDCAARTNATLRRAYYKEDDSLLRQEEARNPFAMPVRTGTPDDRLLREACRPKAAPAPASMSKTVERVNDLAADLRKYNEGMIAQAVKKDARRAPAPASPTTPAPAASPPPPAAAPAVKAPSASAPARRHAARPAAHGPANARRAPRPQWTYEGDAGPEHWAELASEYAVCASGRRQSPIDLDHGFAVDLDPIQFLYQSAPFRVADAGRGLQVTVYGGGLLLQGEHYGLSRVEFHQPSEHTIAGRAFDMEAQFIHRAEDGRPVIVAVMLEKGAENPAVQTALNNLPLEKGGETAPPDAAIDIAALLPAERGYYTFMGSLTAPPCTEGVLWMVLKRPQQISAAQLEIFQRLYPPNARPVQPAYDRIIKESRQGRGG